MNLTFRYFEKTFPLYISLIAIKIVQFQCRSTITPADPFNAKADADRIHEAINITVVDLPGGKTGSAPGDLDEGTVRDIIAHRTCDQRLQIKAAYKEKYPNDPFLDNLDYTTGGGGLLTWCLSPDADQAYQSLMTALFLCDGRIFAEDLKDALNDMGTRESTVVQILITVSEAPEKREKLKNYYKEIIKADMESDIKDDVSGDFRNFLKELLERNRATNNNTVDEKKAQEDAKRLVDEIPKWGDCRQVLDSLLMELPFQQLQATLQEFKGLTGMELRNVIEKEFKGDKRTGYKDLVTFVEDKAAYFATKLHDTLHGFSDLSVDHRLLTRIIVDRCEIDLVEIEESFHRQFNVTLRKKIEEKLSGLYKDLLLALLTKPET